MCVCRYFCPAACDPCRPDNPGASLPHFSPVICNKGKRNCQTGRLLPRLSFTVADALSGLPLSGARFWLSSGIWAESGAGGRVDFGFLEPGSYLLGEIFSPPGYIPEKRRYCVEAFEDGRLYIDGRDACRFSLLSHACAQLSFRTVDIQNGRPLAGAVFRLSNGMQAESGPDGWLNFGVLNPGIYGLMEIVYPAGYRPTECPFRAEIYSDGRIAVDNQTISSFVLRSVPL